jgi:hypothetical protein
MRELPSLFLAVALASIVAHPTKADVDPRLCQFSGNVEGYSSGRVDSDGYLFEYDSRIERVNQTKQYRWCICNLNDDFKAKYRWHSNTTDDSVLNTTVGWKDCGFERSTSERPHNVYSWSIDFSQENDDVRVKNNIDTYYYASTRTPPRSLEVPLLYRADFATSDVPAGFEEFFLDGAIDYKRVLADPASAAKFLGYYKHLDLLSEQSIAIPVSSEPPPPTERPQLVVAVVSVFSQLRLEGDQLVATQAILVEPRGRSLDYSGPYADAANVKAWHESFSNLSSSTRGLEFKLSGADATFSSLATSNLAGLTKGMEIHSKLGSVNSDRTGPVAAIKKGALSFVDLADKEELSILRFEYFAIPE